MRLVAVDADYPEEVDTEEVQEELQEDTVEDYQEEDGTRTEGN